MKTGLWQLSQRAVHFNFRPTMLQAMKPLFHCPAGAAATGRHRHHNAVLSPHVQIRKLFIPASKLHRTYLDHTRTLSPIQSSQQATTDAQNTTTSSSLGTENEIHFDWKLAVALAGCSFEAYADLLHQGIVQKSSDRLNNNSCVAVTYTDAEFLGMKMAGLIQIQIKKLNLLNYQQNSIGTITTFLIICIGVLKS